jgi:hypothetical protein
MLVGGLVYPAHHLTVKLTLVMGAGSPAPRSLLERALLLQMLLEASQLHPALQVDNYRTNYLRPAELGLRQQV